MTARKSSKKPAAAPANDTPVVQTYAEIPLISIRESPHNPRRRFDETALAELADSISVNGVAQPILVRPIGAIEDNQVGDVEIVFGARRFRASKLAGLERIPAMVRMLDDKQAAILQNIENLQRHDVHPIEEAEGYQRMMDEFGYTADELGSQVGKSRSYIYGRLKLAALCEPARDAFYDKKLDASTALLIARIPVPAIQVKVLEEVLEGDLSYRDACELIQRRFMLDLTKAVFQIKDAKLVAAAGACTTCPKRTGNQEDLFVDVKNPNVCTDPDCFASKRTAHDNIMLAQAKKKGIPVFEDEEATDTAFEDGQYVTLNEHVWDFERQLNHNYGTTLDDVLKPEQRPEPAAYGKVQGKVEPLFLHTAMQEALEKAGICETEKQQAKRQAEERKASETAASKATGNTQKAPIKDQNEEVADRETAFRVTLYAAIRTSILTAAADPHLALRTAAKAMVASTMIGDQMNELYDFDADDDEAMHAFIDAANPEQLHLLLLDLAVADSLEVGSWDVSRDEHVTGDDYDRLITLASGCGVDAVAIRKETAPSPAIEVDPGAPKVGDRVLIKNGLKGPGGKLRKCCGREGTIEAINGAHYSVRCGPKPSDVFANLVENELSRMAPALAAKVAPKKKATAPAAPVLNPAAAWPFPTGTRP